MQSSQVRNVGLPSSAEAKRDVPAWTQDPKIFPLDWFSVSRPNIIRQTKEYVSELSKWRNCPKIKTLSKLKAVLKRIMMFLHTHTSYIDGKSLLECDVEEDLITLVSLYMDMELRVLLIKKSAASGPTTSNAPGPRAGSDMDTARNDKLVADRISYWLYTVLTGHEQRVDALLSTTVYTRHTRPVLDPIFRKILNEMSDGPFSSVNYVRHMLAYKTWRERALVTDDTSSEELSARVQQHLVPRDYAFPPPLLRCLGKGDSARDHARPHNVNLADACRNFMRFCREMPCAAAEQINFGSIPLLDDDMLGDEENEVNKLMNMITDRKQRKYFTLSPRRISHEVDAFIDLTLPKSRISRRGILSTVTPDVIDLTEEDDKPVKNSRTSAALEPPTADSPRTAPAVQRISASKKAQSAQDCSYALAPSTPQVGTRCYTAYREQDIYLVKISSMCPVRAHRPRKCQCQDKKIAYHKENKALKTSITGRNYEKDATFVGQCFQFSIGNLTEDDVDTEIQPLVISNSQDQVKLEMRSSAAVTCKSNEDEAQNETTEFCDKLFSASLNHCDCDGCKRRDSNLSRYENRTCTSAETRGESANERVSHPTSVADMYAMEKTSPIVLPSQPSTSWSENGNRLEHFTETLDKRKINLSENNIENNKIFKDNLILSDESLSSNSKNEIRKIKLPVIETETDVKHNKAGSTLRSEEVFTTSTIISNPTKIYEEITESKNTVSPHRSEDTFADSANVSATVVTSNESVVSEKISVNSAEDLAESTNTTTVTILDKTETQVSSAEKIFLTNAQNETSLDASGTKTDIECLEDLTESTSVSTVITTLDKRTPQVPQSTKIISLTNAQKETLLHVSDSRREIDKLCSEILELGCSDLSDIDSVSKKDVTVETTNEDLLQNERLEETLDSCDIFQSEQVPEKAAISFTENKSKRFFLKSLELDRDVNTHLIDIPIEETTEIIAESPKLQSEQSNICQAQLEQEYVNSYSEEKSDSRVKTEENTEEITNEILLSHTEEQEDYMTSSNSTQVDLIEEHAPEIEVESEIVVESNSGISTNLPLLNTINDNQLEHENTSSGNTELPSIKADTEELHRDIIDADAPIQEEVPTEADIHIEQELHQVPIETNVLIKPQEIQTVPLEINDLVEQELNSVPMETDALTKQHFHRVSKETNIFVEQDLQVIPKEKDVIEENKLQTVPIQTDVLVEQELYTVPNETNDLVQEKIQADPIETNDLVQQDVPVEQELYTVSNETNDLVQKKVQEDPIETNDLVQQDVPVEQELYTVSNETNDLVQKKIQADPIETNEQQELLTVPIQTDVLVEQELYTVSNETNDLVQKEIQTVPIETNDFVQQDLHTFSNETNDLVQKELQAVPIQKNDYADISDVKPKVNIRKKRVTFATDIQQMENSVDLKNVTRNVCNLSPRKRRRRKAVEKVHENELTVPINNKSCEKVTDTNNFPKPEFAMTVKCETAQEITVSTKNEENTSAKLKMSDLSEELSTDDSKPNDEKLSDQESLIENVFNEQNSEADKPKRRRKQNLKGVIREDKAALTTSKGDKSTSLTKRKEKELYVVCKMLTRSEIEFLRKNKVESENNIKLTTVEDNENKTKIKPRKKNQIICDSTKEKEKQSKIKVKLRRKTQSVDNNVENAITQTTENKLKNLPLKAMEIKPDIKVKRSRGRPPKMANKINFFSENFNLQNVIEKIEVNSVQETNASLNLEVADEDLPLAYRMSQSIPNRKNSLKSSELDTLSDVENKFNKSEDDLPLSTRKQKLKSSTTNNLKHSDCMKCDTNSEVTYTLQNSKNLELTKPKSFRNKLEQFKFQPKNKSKPNQKCTIQEEETNSLEELRLGNKSTKCIKTYSNTKALKTPELFSTSENFHSKIRKSKSTEQYSDSSLNLNEERKILNEQSVKVTEILKPIVTVVEPLEQISVNNISKEETLFPDNEITKSVEMEDKILLKELNENKHQIESSKIDDMLYKPCNKIYDKQFDFYSDQDDASNSELVIDTSAESSDVEEPAADREMKEVKSDHLTQNQIPVSKQEKYHHSIAEIVNLNEEIKPIENECSTSDTTKISSGDNNITQDHETNDVNLTPLNQVLNEDNVVADITTIIGSGNNDITQNHEVNAVHSTTLNKISNENNVIVDENVVHVDNTKENQFDMNLDIDENTIEETSEKTVQDNTTEHQKRDVCEVFTSLSIPIMKETAADKIIVEETNIAKKLEVTEHRIDIIDDLKGDIVSEEQTSILKAAEVSNLDAVSEEYANIQNTVEEPEEIQKNMEHMNIIRTAEITEISEEIYNELHTEKVTEEELQQLIEPFPPSVEMQLNIEVGFESYTVSQQKPIEGEHAKEGCVKCSVNGKHKDNKKIAVRGIHQYKQNELEEYFEEIANIPDIPYCQVEESFEPNLCTLTAKVVSVTVLTNESPDYSNLCILADIAMSSVHLNTKTENNNVIEIASDRTNEIHDQSPIGKDERCYFVTYPEKMPDSNKPTTSLSIINSNNEEISANVQKLVGGINAKGTVLENKIKALTERAKNETKINELEFTALTSTSPKSDNAPEPIPVVDDEPVITNPKNIESNITIDIPNTALLYLTRDDDDFLIRSEPFSLQTPALQSLPVEIAPKTATTENKELDASEVVKNLYNVIESLTNDQKVSSENKNTDCNTTKEELETKPKPKKGRPKTKSSNNRSSEISYLINKYKNKQDSNKNTGINNQQNNGNKKNTTSFIRSTRPRKMGILKRNANVLDNSCTTDEPAKKVLVHEKMFDKLLEEHRKEMSEAKLKDETKKEISVNKGTENSCVVKDTTIPVLDVTVPETNVLCVPTTHTEELNIPLPVLQYQILESDSRNEKIISETEPTKLDIPIVNVKSQKEDNYTEQVSVETEQSSSLINELSPIKEKLSENTLINTEIDNLAETSQENLLSEKETEKATILPEKIEDKTHTEPEIDKDKDEQIIEKETPKTTDRNASAIEVVQDWFNRVDNNKSHTESYTEITYKQTIDECNFFEEISSTSENSHNVRKSDEKVFSEHHTPDSGIAFDEDSVQKDKLVDSQTPVPENLSDGETYCTSEPEPVTTKTYFSNLSGTETSKPKIQILDIQIIKPAEEDNMKLKVSIALERIKDILPTLTKRKIASPEQNIKKQKEYETELEKGKKRKHSSEELHLNPVAVQDFNKTLLIDCKIKRRKHSQDENVPDYIVEEVVSPTLSQKDVPSTVRTKGSVKEYPDCLFGITEESPVPSGSFSLPFSSDISLAEETVFFEEQLLQRDCSVVDDNPKDVQQGLQPGYCVVDSQFFPLSEYMNDGDYYFIDNKLFNDKRMVPVNMHEVQPEVKPYNTEEVKRGEFDDSEKEDSLSKTVDEIIKNPNLFPEQSTSEIQIISMDQATSEVQVVIACDTYQETELADIYLFGRTSQNELTSCETTSTSMMSDTQHTSMDVEEATPESKVTDKPVDFKPATPVMGSENAQFCNTSVIPVADVPQPVSMELLTAVNSISEPVLTQDVENNEELPNQISKKLTNVEMKLRAESVITDVKKEERNNKICSPKLPSSESHHLNVPTSKTPSYSPSTPTSISAINLSPPIQISPRILQKSSYSKSSKSLSNEQLTLNGDEVFENKITKELEPKMHSIKMSDKNNSTSTVTFSADKKAKKYDYKRGTKILNQRSPYPTQEQHVAIQKPPYKTYDSSIHSHYPPPNKKPTDPKMYPKTYNSKVPLDAFDELKQAKTDISPPPDSRTRYHNFSRSNLNLMKTHSRKDTSPADFHRAHSSVRESPRLRHSTQLQSYSRRPHSAYTEPSPKPAYLLPPSDPTYQSSQYNCKKTDVKPSHSKNITEQNRHCQSSSSSSAQAHTDWLNDEKLLNLIQKANAFYSNKN